jgi:hypothetical protein
MSNLPNRSQQAKGLKLELLAPGQQRTIDTQTVESIGVPLIRERCSRINREFDGNFRVHKYPDGSVGIWHDPSPRKIQVQPIVGNLLELRKQFVALPNDQAHLNERLALHEQIQNIWESLKQPIAKNAKGGLIRQPLEVVLNHIHLSKEEWDLIPSRDKTRIRIQAEIEIREQQRQLEAK